jgi:hypothetical protein
MDHCSFSLHNQLLSNVFRQFFGFCKYTLKEYESLSLLHRIEDFYGGATANDAVNLRCQRKRSP